MSEGDYLRDFYPSGKIIFEEGHIGNDLYIIEEGNVVIWKRVGNEKKILVTIGKGKIFGEMAIIEPDVRSATAEAAPSGATCVKISAQKLELMLAQTPPMLRMLLKTLVLNLRRSQK